MRLRAHRWPVPRPALRSETRARRLPCSVTGSPCCKATGRHHDIRSRQLSRNCRCSTNAPTAGADTTGELDFAYPRNPVGRGLVLQDPADRTVQLPNFEDPNDLLTPERLILGDVKRWSRQPLPQGLGWFAKTWYPRMSFVGVIPGFVDADEIMPEEALGLVPRNQIALGRQFRLPSFDVRFNNGASPGLALPHPRGHRGGAATPPEQGRRCPVPPAGGPPDDRCRYWAGRISAGGGAAQRRHRAGPPTRRSGMAWLSDRTQGLPGCRTCDVLPDGWHERYRRRSGAWSAAAPRRTAGTDAGRLTDPVGAGQAQLQDR